MPKDAQYKYFDRYYKVVDGVIHTWLGHYWYRTCLNDNWFRKEFLVAL
ncbi:hypothetical protein [Acinetobacter sp. UBA801]|nr:hypothetical protein [Acinetobacter sp. UBA801]